MLVPATMGEPGKPYLSKEVCLQRSRTVWSLHRKTQKRGNLDTGRRPVGAPEAVGKEVEDCFRVTETSQ